MKVKNLTMKFILLAFATTYNVYPTIEIDDNQTFQKIDGFGFTLTGGSAQVINQSEPISCDNF